jgi:hypothetical protein
LKGASGAKLLNLVPQSVQVRDRLSQCRIELARIKWT